MPSKIGRNEPCPSGSGKKYKKCHQRVAESFQHQPMIFPNPAPQPEPFLNIVPNIMHKGHRIRAIWSTIHFRPPTETFHEFVLNVLRWTLGAEWFQQQRELPRENWHVILRWLESFGMFTRERRPDDVLEGTARGAVPSGDVEALISLAYDVFCLQSVNKLPAFLVDRLKDRMGFQGVRYEIAVAAIMARSDFEITFLDDRVKSQKHCEFIATDRQTIDSCITNVLI